VVVELVVLLLEIIQDPLEIIQFFHAQHQLVVVMVLMKQTVEMVDQVVEVVQTLLGHKLEGLEIHLL
jgi:hypothetical protein